MKKKFSTHHFVLRVVTHVNKHRDESSCVIYVNAPLVSHFSLMNIHPHPQFVRLVLNLAQRRSLFVDSIFTVGNVTGF